MIALKGVILIILLGIAYQDFKFRAVYWWLFPLLILALGTVSFYAVGLEVLFKTAGLNTVFLALQLFCLFAYFSLKEKRMVNLFAHYFGLGDLLFLVCITLYFPFLNYVCFYVLSLILVILVSGLFSRLKSGHVKIPLAGYQSVLMLICLVVDQVSAAVNLFSDDWLNRYLIY